MHLKWKRNLEQEHLKLLGIIEGLNFLGIYNVEGYCMYERMSLTVSV